MATDEWVEDRCSCGTRIIQAVTVRGDPLPLNALPSTDGEYQLVARGEGKRPLARHLTVVKRFGKRNLRVSHLTRCLHRRRNP